MPNPLLNRVPQNKLPEDMQAVREELLRRCDEADVLEVMMNHPAMTR